MKIYIKKKGNEQFYEAAVGVRISERGYKIATLTDAVEISRSKFYKQDNDVRFILPTAKNGYEIHEVGNKKFFEKLEAKQ